MNQTTKEVLSSKKAVREKYQYIRKMYWRPEMTILPGQIAFFIILSLVPLITLIGYGASFLNLSIESIMELLETNLNPGVANMIEPMISGNINTSLLVMFVVMFYIASNGPASIVVASNTIYNIPQKSWIKRRIKALALTFLLVILYLFVLLLPVFGYHFISAIDPFNLRPFLINTLHVLQVPISWLIIFIFIKIIYTVSPDQPILSKYMNLGAAFTTTGWVITSALYGYYVRNIAQHDVFYGGLSNLAILMLWIYFLSIIFVIGMSINYNTLEQFGKNRNK